ncbi:MAG: hypothetical protein IT283_03390, partial [Bacteroidetes bacterium]|nr:hypothetical protein [Bacteroidota bacterium]
TGGSNNFVSAISAAVIGGTSDSSTNDNSVVAGGQGNRASGQKNFIGGGSDNKTNGNNSAIVGGQGLTLGDNSLGFNATGTANMMSQNIVYFGNANTYIGNSTNNAGELRFMEPTATPQSANYTAFKAQAQSVDVTYTLPNTAGTNGQVLTTDGSGVLSWTTPSGGGGGNAWQLLGNSGTTVNNFIGTTDNMPLRVRANNAQQMQFNVNGSIQRDGGGSSRGQNAVDLQNVRTLATQAAIGTASFIGAGQNNTVTGDYSAIVGGNSNQAQNVNNFIGGGQGNTANSENSAVVGGVANSATSAKAAVVGGQSNTANAVNSAVVGGTTNTASNQNAFIGGGQNNTANEINATIVGGTTNTAANQNAFVGGGQSNTANSINSAIIGGSDNINNGQASLIGAGMNNTINGNYSSILGGQGLTLAANSVGFNGSGTANMNSQSSIAYFGNVNTYIGNSDNTARELRFMEPTALPGSANYTAFKAQAQSVDVTYTLPNTAGTNGQVLTTDGSGTLSWTAPLGSLTSDSVWKINGNTIYGDSTSKFLGTTNAMPLSFRTNNTDRMRIQSNTGNVGINTTAPKEKLEVSNGNVLLSTTNATTASLRFQEANAGADYVAFKAPSTIPANVTWTLPNADGTNGQVLTTNGSGTLSWTNAVTGVTILRQSYQIDLNEIEQEEQIAMNVTLTGAQTTGTVYCSPGTDLPEGIVIVYCRVVSANNVRVVFRNERYPFADINPALMWFHITVIQ